MSDRHKLLFSWPAEPQSHPSLPKGITRTFIPTPLGRLEILIAQPSSASSDTYTSPQRKKALLFQHGGFGFAGVWTDYMLYFAARGYPCYAVSLRGHGASWKPGYWKMTWWYGKPNFAQDLSAAVNFVSGVETGLRSGTFNEADLVLLGHSAGGGLAQYFLSQQRARVGAMCLMAAFPSFGGYGVYWNWAKMDPWFAPRYYIRDLWHSRSPLSSTTLVHNAFLSPGCPRERVLALEKGLCKYESMVWPLGMMLPFVNKRRIVSSIIGWGGPSNRMLVVAGEKDVLMRVPLMEKMAGLYRVVVERLGFWSKGKGTKLTDEDNEEDSAKEDECGGVKFEIVNGGGHHFMNEVHWEEGAHKVELFLAQL